MRINYQDKLKELKAKVFLGIEVEYEEWFSLGINATCFDDTSTSEAAFKMLDRPIRKCSNFLLLEYFRVLLEKETTKKDQATKLLKTLLSKTSKSFVIRTVLDSPNKILRKHLIEELKQYKRFKDRDKLFLIEILWERGVISRKAADASLQYFLHYESSGSVTPLILSKEHIRSIHDAYQHDKNASIIPNDYSKYVTSSDDVLLRMIISLIYLKMNLVKKAFDTFYPVSLHPSFIKKREHSWELFFAIENKESGDNTSPKYFKDYEHFKDTTQYLDTKYSQYFDIPCNQAALIAGGLNCSNLFTFAFNSLKYSRDLSIVKTVNKIVKRLDPVHYCYKHKMILGHLPLIKKLNKEFPNEHVTSEINDYFLSKKHYFHDVALLIFPKDSLKKFDLDIKHIKQKFKNYCMRMGFHDWDRTAIIFKHLYLNGDGKTRKFLRQIIIDQCFVEDNYSWEDNDEPTVCSIDYEQIEKLSSSISYLNKELGQSFYKSIIKKLLKLRYDKGFKDSRYTTKADIIWKEISKHYSKRKINQILTKPRLSNDDFDLLNTLEVLQDLHTQSFLSFYLENYSFLRFERSQNHINLFCKHFISTCKNTSFQTRLKNISSKYHGLYTEDEYHKLLSSLIFGFFDDKSFGDFINKFSLEEQLNFLPIDPKNTTNAECYSERKLKKRRAEIISNVSKLDNIELRRCYENFLDDSFNKDLYKFQNTYKRNTLVQRFLEVFGEKDFEATVHDKLRQFKVNYRGIYLKNPINTEYKNYKEFHEVNRKLFEAGLYAEDMLQKFSRVSVREAKVVRPIINKARNLSDYKEFLAFESADFETSF